MADREQTVARTRFSALIARTAGIVAIAGGFVGGMYGLEHPETMWLRTSLGLIVTGLLAQGYALICTARWLWEREESNRR